MNFYNCYFPVIAILNTIIYNFAIIGTQKLFKKKRRKTIYELFGLQKAKTLT